LRRMSVCKECIEDKISYKDSTLPCLEFENLWASGRFRTAKEILCELDRIIGALSFAVFLKEILKSKFEKSFQMLLLKPKKNGARAFSHMLTMLLVKSNNPIVILRMCCGLITVTTPR
jgi:hypothetical protein